MKRPAPLPLAAGTLLAASLTAGTALAPRPAPAAAQALSGFDVFRSTCGGCHELYDPEEPKRTRQEWEVILNRMVKVRGAALNQQEFAAVLNYLDSFNRPRREIEWQEGPAKSHAFAPAADDAGKLPAQWVDLISGADTHVPWAVQLDPASKAAYLSPLKSAEDDQLPVLVDNSGVAQDASVTTRLQLLSGKKAGAGVVFGFRSPQSFYGVRVGPRDIILYEVNNGQRALLGRAPAGVPLKQWQTVAVSVANKAVKVSVNGKPVPELTQTVAAYRGGKLGLHTQGDTVALFDQWQVEVR